MTIIIDLRCLTAGGWSGVEVYTENLLTNLLASDRQNNYKIFTNSLRRPAYNFNKWLKYKNVSLYQFHLPNKLLNLSFKLFSWPKIDRWLGGGDVYWLPNLNFSAWSKLAKSVLTVHDLSFEQDKRFFSLKRRLWHKLVNPKKLCQNIDKVIAVSENTKQDLIQKYQIDSHKIEVVYSGLKQSPSTKSSQKFVRGFKDFILFLGTLEPRKNLTTLISAFNMASASLPKRVKLILAGKVGWRFEAIHKAYLESALKDDIILTGELSEADKWHLLKMAKVLAYPSLYEGFGFPALEAAAVGTAVIASSSSSFPEIAGDFALLVDPSNIMEVSQAIKAVYADEKLRQGMIKSGQMVRKSFKWEKTARQTLNIFNSFFNYENRY